jgi:hypothetical protein
MPNRPDRRGPSSLQRRHRTRPPHILSQLLRGCSTGLVALALLAPSSLATTFPDRLSTHTYLQASLEYTQALVKNAPAAAAAESKHAASIAHECSGVLTGAPGEAVTTTGEAPPTPRVRGERLRATLQLSTIREELTQALTNDLYGGDRIALEALTAKLAPLRWSDPRIAALIRSELAAMTEEIEPSALNVCADMKSWAESGYRTLSTASRACSTASTAPCPPR